MLSGMPDEHHKSPIDKLEDNLYSRTSHIKHKNRSSISPEDFEVNTAWGGNDDLEKALQADSIYEEKTSTFFHKLFIASVIFFVVAIGIASVVFFGGINSVSSKNVDILVKGLVAIGSGDELVLDVTAQNNNNVPLENVDLVVQYPTGSKQPGNLSADLVREKYDIGTIAPGKSFQKTISAIILGEKNSIQDIKMTLEYKTQGSNAVVSKEKIYQVSINSSPIVVTVDYPQEINSNQNIEFKITVASNSTGIIPNVLLKAEYPFGFTFASASPVSVSDNSLWRIGDLNAKEKRVITIKGKLEGQDNEERTFRFNVGSAETSDSKKISIALATNTETISIKKPFIGLSVNVNGSQDKEVAMHIGDKVSGHISWVNNLPVDINNAQLEVTIDGATFDRSSVIPDNNGFYQSLNNLITWNGNSTGGLRQMHPGEGGSVGFTFNSLDSGSLGSAQKDGTIIVSIAMKGTRFSGGSSPQEVLASATRTVKIVSDLQLASDVVYSFGPFGNTGPIPPRAEQETTYTVRWVVRNTFNDVTGTRVTATLPQYVRWVGAVNPTSERVSFDPISNTITWNVGEVKGGAGYSTSPREANFQIALLPSITQVGTAPNLVENIAITGQDRFTGSVLGGNLESLTTNITSDTKYGPNDYIIKK